MLRGVVRRLPRGLLAAGLVWMVGAGVASAAPAMWEVRDKDSVVYLFGSMHVLRPDVRWRTAAFDRAYAAADKVWFETRIDVPPERIQSLVDQYGVDPSALSPKNSRPRPWPPCGRCWTGAACRWSASSACGPGRRR